MKQPPELVALSTAAIVQRCRRDVSNTDLRSALEELLPKVLVEHICTAKQCAYDVALAVFCKHFLFFEPQERQHTQRYYNYNTCEICLQIRERRLCNNAINNFFDLIEIKLIKTNMLKEEDINSIGDAAVHSWLENLVCSKEQPCVCIL